MLVDLDFFEGGLINNLLNLRAVCANYFGRKVNKYDKTMLADVDM